MAVVLRLWIYFMAVVAKCKYFVMSYIRQNKKRKRTGIHRAICYCGMWACLSTKLKGKSSSLTTEKHVFYWNERWRIFAERKDEESWRCVTALIAEITRTIKFYTHFNIPHNNEQIVEKYIFFNWVQKSFCMRVQNKWQLQRSHVLKK